MPLALLKRFATPLPWWHRPTPGDSEYLECGIFAHGFTVDSQGRKMSKSLGNGVDPQKTSEKLGAEIIRLWVAASDYSGDIAGDDKILARVVDSYRRISNTLHFLLANTNDFNP